MPRERAGCKIDAKRCRMMSLAGEAADAGRAVARSCIEILARHVRPRVLDVGRQVYGGGENSLAVFSIDQKTGEPTLIQHVDTRGFHPRTFHIDPSGRMLVAAHITPMQVREGSNVVTVPATMSVFRIADDGKLTYVSKYDVDVGKAFMWWMGMVAL